MSNSTGVAFSFSGHETFPFRCGWLKKGIDAISNDPSFFSDDRAMSKLGVGKNMVRSIRHWLLTARLCREIQRGRLAATDIGQRLLLDDGFDPYLEDPATLWLIHWLIASNPNMATTWFWAFGHWNAVEFTKDKLASEMKAWMETHGHYRISDNSIKRDLDCFVRTYVQSRQTKTLVLEDSLDCPLVDLKLIAEIDNGRAYRFQRGPQATLPDEVFAFALIEYWRSSSIDTMAFQQIAFAPGGPGRIFKLDEDSMTLRLDRLERITDGFLLYDETAGIKQVYRRTGKEVADIALLESHYRNH
jgi:hypothetical protein